MGDLPFCQDFNSVSYVVGPHKNRVTEMPQDEGFTKQKGVCVKTMLTGRAAVVALGVIGLVMAPGCDSVSRPEDVLRKGPRSNCEYRDTNDSDIATRLWFAQNRKMMARDWEVYLEWHEAHSDMTEQYIKIHRSLAKKYGGYHLIPKCTRADYETWRLNQTKTLIELYPFEDPNRELYKPRLKPELVALQCLDDLRDDFRANEKMILGMSSEQFDYWWDKTGASPGKETDHRRARAKSCGTSNGPPSRTCKRILKACKKLRKNISKLSKQF